MQRTKLFSLFLLVFLTLATLVRAQSEQAEAEILVDLQTAGLAVENPLNIQQINALNAPSPAGSQQVNILQAGIRNDVNIGINSTNTTVNLIQGGRSNDFRLGIGNGNNNKIEALQFRGGNISDLQFGTANDLDLTIIQNGGDFLKIDVQNSETAPIPSRINMIRPGLRSITITDNN